MVALGQRPSGRVEEILSSLQTAHGHEEYVVQRNGSRSAQWSSTTTGHIAAIAAKTDSGQGENTRAAQIVSFLQSADQPVV